MVIAADADRSYRCDADRRWQSRPVRAVIFLLRRAVARLRSFAGPDPGQQKEDGYAMRQILAVAAVVGLLTAGCAQAEETPAPQINATDDSVEIPEAGLRSTDPEPQPPAGDTPAASQPGGDPVDAASDDPGVEPAGTAPDISEPAEGDPVDAASDDPGVEPAGTAPDISEPAEGDPVGAASDDTADISSVEQEDSSGADNAASMEPEAAEFDETELMRAPQPVWHDGITAQDYFAELIPWMLDEDEPGYPSMLHRCLRRVFQLAASSGAGRSDSRR